MAPEIRLGGWTICPSPLSTKARNTFARFGISNAACGCHCKQPDLEVFTLSELVGREMSALTL